MVACILEVILNRNWRNRVSLELYVILDRVLLKFRRGSLSVDDGFLASNFQKIVQILFQLRRSFMWGYVEIRLISDFLDVNWEFDLAELVDEVVDSATSRGFWRFQCTGVDQMAVETTRAISDENPRADVEGGAFGCGRTSLKYTSLSALHTSTGIIIGLSGNIPMKPLDTGL